MNRKISSPGYGYSLEGRQSAFKELYKELEANLPTKSEQCPPTAEMMDLALGLPIPARTERLQAHLTSCDYCRSRFSAQQRAVQRACELSARSTTTMADDVHEELCERRRRSRRGNIFPLGVSSPADVALPMGADGGTRTVRQVLVLPPLEDAPSRSPVKLTLDWTQPGTGSQGKADPTSWTLTARMSAQSQDPENGNDEADLNELAGRELMLVLKGEEQTIYCPATKMLLDDQNEGLVVQFEKVRLSDPGSLKEGIFTPGDRLQEYDLS